MSAKTEKSPYPQACNPLILHAHRLMEAFAKSNDERDFYLDSVEGFIVYVDLDESEEALSGLEGELIKNRGRYLEIPKMTFYESKKLMEGFVNEKVYDIDVKEKLLDIIGSKEARENFLEYIYDHHSELEKWQQYYQERSRIRIIEWLRTYNLRFVFEEDLDFTKNVLEKVKENLFNPKAPSDVVAARKALDAKAKTYYSDSALNPRPKRGRPPKQQQKVEIEPTVTSDFYSQVPAECRKFLYTPDLNSSSKVTFSSKYESEEELLASIRESHKGSVDPKLESLNQKLESLRQLSGSSLASKASMVRAEPKGDDFDEDYDEEADLAWDDEEMSFDGSTISKAVKKKASYRDEDYATEEFEEADVYEELEKEREEEVEGEEEEEIEAPVEKKASPKKGVGAIKGEKKGAVEGKKSVAVEKPKGKSVAESKPAAKGEVKKAVVGQKKPVVASKGGGVAKKGVVKPAVKTVGKPVAKPVAKGVKKPVAKPVAKVVKKPVAKPVVKGAVKGKGAVKKPVPKKK